MTQRIGAVVLVLAVGVVAGAEQAAYTPPRGLQDQQIAVPDSNPLTPARIRLGEQLFFDVRLSRNDAMACETCHVPEKGWTDGKVLSPKWDGSMNTRHSPTLYEVAYYPELYWDGRAQGLETQILAAWKGNMGADPDAIAAKLAAIPGYAKGFEAAFGAGPSGERIVQALASFARTIHAGDTPWDRRDRAATDTPEVRGFTVFSEVARCTLCHLPPVYSDGLFHNVGIGSGDGGRGAYLAKAAEKAGQPVPEEAAALQGAFKTPTLRGAALSGPYFHDGSVATLEQAVDVMAGGGIANPLLDPKLKRVELTPQQRSDLLAFVRALTPAAEYPRPTLP